MSKEAESKQNKQELIRTVIGTSALSMENVWLV